MFLCFRLLRIPGYFRSFALLREYYAQHSNPLPMGRLHHLLDLLHQIEGKAPFQLVSRSENRRVCLLSQMWTKQMHQSLYSCFQGRLTCRHSYLMKMAFAAGPAVKNG